MKKLLALTLALVLAFSMVGCSKPAEDPAAPVVEGYELALVTDVGTIDDKSFNQGSWEGLAKYATEKNITHKYYQPKEKTTDAYIDTIGLAVEGGAKVVVCPGFLFEQAVLATQETYPEVKFIILDGIPNNGAFDDTRVEKVGDNTYSVFYNEHEVGFLAGYAAVKDGYRQLGFVGGMAVPAVIRFGYGYVQGADYAAKELGLSKDEIGIKYHYTGGFAPSPEIQALAASWYQSGTEVIFTAAGGGGNSVMASAEAAGKKMIGVDVDQSAESDSVITSATKGLGESVYQALEAFYAGTFPGGQSVSLGATTNGIALPMATSKFTTFTQADYDAIYAKIVDGTISGIATDKDADSAAGVKVELVKVEVVE